VTEDDSPTIRYCSTRNMPALVLVFVHVHGELVVVLPCVRRYMGANIIFGQLHPLLSAALRKNQD
jgi:hypothetical protein